MIDDSRQAGVATKRQNLMVTEKMIDVGTDAVIRWQERYGVRDVPAMEELVRMVLLASVTQPQ